MTEATAADDVLTPPYCNTGVETSFRSGVKIDWLEFTLWNWPLTDAEVMERNEPLNAYEKARMEYGLDDLDQLRPGPAAWTPEEVKELVGMANFELTKVDRGMHGYRRQYLSGPARILADGNADMGLHVILSADALEFTRPADKIIRAALGGLGKFTRIDLAIDDFDGALDLQTMCSYARAGKCVTRAAEGSIWESFAMATGETTGLTLYIGSRKSDHYFRIYDKRLERINEGADPATLPAHWIRVEAELTGPAAVNVSRMLYDGADVAATVKGIINNYFRFAEPRGIHRYRWKPAPWWADFLATDHRLSVSREVKAATLESRRAWFAQQAAPSMVMLGEAFGADELTEIFAYAQRNLKDGQKAEVAKHKDRRKARRDQFTETLSMEAPPCLTRV